MNMHHVAILKKQFLDKILAGRKSIESRWYKTKRSPWNRIKTGDIVYLKYSSGMVVAKASVSRVLQFENLNEQKISWIAEKYGKMMGIDGESIKEFVDRHKGRRYCILIFLDKVEKITPFRISKKGFGNQAAWMVVNNIEKIKS